MKSEATGGFIGVDTNGFVPRLAVAFDPGGNGRNVFHATYGHYSGRYNEAQIGGNNNVGNPDLIIGSYNGPAGQGRDFAPGFTPANYETVLGQFPTANIFLEDGLTSPIVKEFTLSYGAQLMNGKGYGEVSYIVRRTSHIIDDTITLANGVTDVVKDGLDVGTFTNVIYRNLDIARRSTKGLSLPGPLRHQAALVGERPLHPAVKNNGNNEGEDANKPGVTEQHGRIPGDLHLRTVLFPDGRLSGFQRHKLALWSIYNLGLGKIGDVTGVRFVARQFGRHLQPPGHGSAHHRYSSRADLDAGYPDAPSDQTSTSPNVDRRVQGLRRRRPRSRLQRAGLQEAPAVRQGRDHVQCVEQSEADSVEYDRESGSGQRRRTHWDWLPGTPRAAVSGRRPLVVQYFPSPFTGDANAPFTGGRTYRAAVGFRF